MSLGQACVTFISRNIGVFQVERVKKGVNTSILLDVAVTAGTSALTLVLSRLAFGLFAKEASVAELGVQIARAAYPFYFVYVFLEVYSSVIRGAGKSLPAMGIIVGNMCLVRTCILKGILSFKPGVVGVAAVYPITWMCTAVCLFLYYRSGRWIP